MDEARLLEKLRAIEALFARATTDGDASDAVDATNAEGPNRGAAALPRGS
jgi:hypothetical protein